MKLLVLTSNQPRHVAFVKALMAAGHDVVTVVEPKTYVPPTSPVMARYWERVRDAEVALFPACYYMPGPVLAIRPGELSNLNPWMLPERFPVIFSSSYLKGFFAEEMIKAGALNLHVGIAPEYRGSAPNFWALYDGREDCVGAQVQRLSKGLDAGDILAETRVAPYGDPFERGMLAVKQGITMMLNFLEHYQYASANPPVRPNDRTKQLRYARHDDFTEQVVAYYLKRLDAAT